MLLLKVFSEKSYLLNEGLNQKGSQFKNGPKFEILENENCFVKQFLSLSFQDTGAFLGLLLRVFYCSKVLSFIVFATSKAVKLPQDPFGDNLLKVYDCILVYYWGVG